MPSLLKSGSPSGRAVVQMLAAEKPESCAIFHEAYVPDLAVEREARCEQRASLVSQLVRRVYFRFAEAVR